MFKEWNKNYIGDHPAVCNSTAGFVYLSTSLYQRRIWPPMTLKVSVVTPLKMGTTPNLKISKSTDFDQQIVYMGVIDRAESKSCLVSELGILLNCDFG